MQNTSVTTQSLLDTIKSELFYVIHHWKYLSSQVGSLLVAPMTSGLMGGKTFIIYYHLDSLVHDCGNPGVLTMELPQYCAKPLIWHHFLDIEYWV